MDEDRSEKVQEFIKSVRDLSTLPSVMKKIMAFTIDPDVSISRMEEAFSTDPVISTRLLRIVNSAYYSFFREITSIRQAIVVLGLNATRSLVIGTSIINLLGRESKIEHFPLEGFWKYSVGCGNISSTLASLLDYNFYQEAFLAGLIHDIGKIAIANNRPELFEQALNMAHAVPMPLRRAEEAVIGFDHCDVGRQLSTRWRLPHLLEEVIAFNETPGEAERYVEVVAIVRLAAQICRLHGIGISGEPETEIDLQSEESWQILSDRTPLMQTLDFERFAASLEEEAVRVESFVQAIFED